MEPIRSIRLKQKAAGIRAPTPTRTGTTRPLSAATGTPSMTLTIARMSPVPSNTNSGSNNNNINSNNVPRLSPLTGKRDLDDTESDILLKEDSWKKLIEEGIDYLKSNIACKEDLLDEINGNLRSASMQLIHREALKDLETIKSKAQELEDVFISLREMTSTSFDLKLDALSADTDIDNFEENNQEEVDLTEDEEQSEDISQASSQLGITLPPSGTPSPTESMPRSGTKRSSTGAVIATSAAWEQRYHRGRLMFKCKWPGCNHYVQCKASIYKHRATVHGVNNDYPSECYKCGKVFANSKSLRSHLGFHTKVARLNSLYPDQQTPDEETMNTEEAQDDNSIEDMDIGVQGAVHDSEMSSSASQSILDDVTRLPPKVINMATSENGVVIKKFLCPYKDCRQMFGFKSPQYYEHEKSHLGRSGKAFTFICTVSNCSKSFESEDRLMFHQSECHSDNGSNFTSPAIMFKDEDDYDDEEEYVEEEEELPQFKCDFYGCGKEFPQKIALKVHKLSHVYAASGSMPAVVNAPDAPYECRVCNQKFTSSKSLISHLGHHRRKMNASSISPERQRSLLLKNTDEPSPSTGKTISASESIANVGGAGFFYCEVCKLKKYSNRIRRNYGIISCSACTKFFSSFMNSPEVYTCVESGNCAEAESPNDSDSMIAGGCKACRIVQCFENFTIAEDQKTKLLETYGPVLAVTGEKLHVKGYHYDEEANGFEDNDNFEEVNGLGFDDNQFNEFGFLDNNEENDVQNTMDAPSNYRLVTCVICNGSRVTDQPSQHYGQTSCRSCFDCFRRFMKKPRLLVCEQNVSCLSKGKHSEFSVIGCKACIVKQCFDLYQLDDKPKVESMTKLYLQIPQLGLKPQINHSEENGDGNNNIGNEEDGDEDEDTKNDIGKDEDNNNYVSDEDDEDKNDVDNEDKDHKNGVDDESNVSGKTSVNEDVSDDDNA